MADDQFNSGAGTNWWDASSRSRFDASAGSSSSSPGLNASFGWPTEMADVKVRPNSMDSASASSVVFQDKLHDQSGTDPHQHHLRMMGLGLSSHPVDWNEALLRGDKPDHQSGLRLILQENMNTGSNYQQESGSIASSSSSSQVQWKEKMFTDSPVNEFKHLNRGGGGFFIEQSQFSPHGSSSDSTVTARGLPSTNFLVENPPPSLYGAPTMFQGLLGSSDQHHNQFGAPSANYGMSSANNINSNELLHSNWHRPLAPPFLRGSLPPKQQQLPGHNQLQFSNNAPLWGPSAVMNEVRPSFYPIQPSFDEKPKNLGEIRDSSSVMKKSGSDQQTAKRARNETASSSPAFKVRKEKMGDRIAALQQLVSPFGKTDAASVLSEAIEYIKLLHEQVTILSSPYMKRGASSQQSQQTSDKTKDPEGPKQDLRSQGLCLVPVPSMFQVTHETAVDFWPTFGGTFR